MSSDNEEAFAWEGDEARAASAPANSTKNHPPAQADNAPETAASDADAPPAALPRGWKALGKGSDAVGTIEDDGTVTAPAAAPALSNAMLLFLGIFGGIYLLYTIGWLLGGLALPGKSLLLLSGFVTSGAVYYTMMWAAVLAPALWFGATWLLTRHKPGVVRVAALVAGAVLLVPWPFVMSGAIG